MLPINTMRKTVQLGLRIDGDLLKKIERMAQHENIDKMSWIRRALGTFLKGEEEEAVTMAVEDYISLRIDETELKKISSFSKIPEDIQAARKEVLLRIKKEARKK